MLKTSIAKAKAMKTKSITITVRKIMTNTTIVDKKKDNKQKWDLNSNGSLNYAPEKLNGILVTIVVLTERELGA